MAIRTPWACSLFLALLSGCREPSPPAPTLSAALKAPGDAGEKAKALLRVAFQGEAGTRAEAFFLAGLFACDAGSPMAAARAFSLAKLEGPRAWLAGRRLGEACTRAPLPPRALASLKEQAWLSQESWERISLASAEAWWRKGEVTAAQAALGAVESYGPANRPRARVLWARLRPEEARQAQQALLLESPQVLISAFPEVSWQSLAGHLTSHQWRQVGQAWLAAGAPQEALAAARKAGREGVEVATRALLLLRRSREAEAMAMRIRDGEPQRNLLLAHALRQQAWSSEGAARGVLFARMAQAARRALGRTQGSERAEAQVLLAEALVETGQLSEVPQLLRQAAESKPARWDWVARRFLLHAARQGLKPELAPELLGPRLRRLRQFWVGFLAWHKGDRSGLEELASSGHPDLAARWAANLVGVPVVWLPSELAPEAPPPPAWSQSLMAAGRTSDVVLAWRASLEATGEAGAAWLGLLQLAKLPPLDAIPLLNRAEPRLLSGPWHGVPRSLLRQYLPLPYADELQRAAQAYRIPPWYLAAVVRQESAFNPQVRSAKGALGLAQLLPQTAGLPEASLLQPGENLRAGAKFLAFLLERFAGHWEPTLAAYNAGERRVRQAWEQAKEREGPFFVEALELPETWDYVHRVMLFAEGYRALYWPENS